MVTRRVRLFALLFMIILTDAVSATANDKPWSDWAAAQGDDAIQFRWQLVTYGGGLAPDCKLQLRNTFADVTAVVVRFSVEQLN